jgi:hypothetical protein
MTDWHDDAQRLRDEGHTYVSIAFLLGIPVHRVRYAISERYRIQVRKRVLWQRALKRARKAFGVVDGARPCSSA